MIYDAPEEECIPSGFNTINLRLDARLEATLDWREAEARADRLVAKGFYLFWEMDLGLFQGLTQPLSDQTQFLSLTLSITHFLETLWKKFRPQTLGVILYRGSLNPVERDQAVAYLKLLANRFPEAVELFLLFDVAEHSSLFEVASLLHPERFSRFHLGVKGSSWPIEGLVWESKEAVSGYLGKELPRMVVPPTCKVGVCLPSVEREGHHAPHQIDAALKGLLARKIPFRLVPEAYLTGEWEELDYLLVDGEMDGMGLRKLQGFCAAGGTIVCLGKPLQLPHEESFDAWLSTVYYHER